MAPKPKSSAAITDRNFHLDVLRALAILAVLMVHTASHLDDKLYSIGNHLPAFLRHFTDLGSSGVQLFFLISGWLLEILYGSGGWNPKSYLVRRFARIYPLWVAFLLLSFVLPYLGLQTGVTDLLGGHPAADWATGSAVILLATLTFTLWLSPSMWNTAVPGGWSIQAEVGHYIFFPLLRRLKSHWLILALAGIRIATALLVQAANTMEEGVERQLILAWARLGLADTLVFFVLGMLIGRWVARVWRPGVTELAALALLLAGGLLDAPGSLVILQKLLFICGCFGLSLVFLKWNAFASTLSVISRYSYFTYFVHWFVLRATINVLDATGLDRYLASSQVTAVLGLYLLFPFTVAVSTGFGALSWRYFEKPIIDWSRRF